jgi:hypothetical protein
MVEILISIFSFYVGYKFGRKAEKWYRNQKGV